MNKKFEAFTLVEVIIAVTIILILSAVLFPNVLYSLRMAKALQCGSSMRAIETAKAHWRMENPDWQSLWTNNNRPSSNDLAKYFTSSTFPQDPWKVGFSNVLNPFTNVSHVFNGNPKYEPKGSTNPLANGYNDHWEPDDRHIY